MNVVETHDLTKIYDTGQKKGNITALNAVTLSVRPSEVFGLLGPNGAGKTTLVKILLGITSITSGQALIGGLPPSQAASRDKVGFLQENPRFPAHLSGRDLLAFTGRLCGLRPSEIEARAKHLLALVGLEKWGTTKVRKYSKGMNERVGLAQAMMNDPDIVFLDEPTDGIDPVGKREIRDILKRIRDEGKTVFLNSHLLSEVELIADRVAILSRGRVVRTGTVSELTIKESQFDIEADIGDARIQVPPEKGKIINITARSLCVALTNPDDINWLIDELRIRRISIRSIKPMTQTLEQSFFDLMRDQGGGDL